MTYKTVICENLDCRKQFKARLADIARGWGRFCCKSCKAAVQSRNGGKLPALPKRGKRAAQPRRLQPKDRPRYATTQPKRPVNHWEVEHQRAKDNFDEYDRICAEEDQQ